MLIVVKEAYDFNTIEKNMEIIKCNKLLNLNPQLEANWTSEFKPTVCVFNYAQKRQNERTSWKCRKNFIAGWTSKERY